MTRPIKIHWMSLLILCPLLSPAQTIVRSMQIANNRNTLSMNVVGTRDGRLFRHRLRYDVTGLTDAQRNALYEQSVQTLATLGIKNVPGLRRQDQKKATAPVAVQAGSVTIVCATCTRKGYLELYGSNYLQTRRMKPDEELQNRFPVTLQLGPDQYRLVYKQRGRRQVEVPFLLSAGEEKQLTIR